MVAATWDSGFMDDQSGVPVPISGNLYVVFGWFKSTGTATGGAIDTGFKNIHQFYPIPHADAVGNGIVVNAVFADTQVVMVGPEVTIVTDAAEVGRWMAIGN